MDNLPNRSPAPEVKRRKLRKGTHSCWECKRRKVRCTFAAPTNTICITCQRRGTKCISQRLPEEPGQATDNAGRIVRVEALLNQLVEKVGYSAASDAVRPPSSTSREFVPTPSSYLSSTPTSVSEVSDKYYDRREDVRKQELPPSFSTPSSLATPTPVRFTLTETTRNRKLSQALCSAFPASRDTEILLERVGEMSNVCYQSNIVTRSVLREGIPKEKMQLPGLISPETHPVLLGKQMIMFASALQYLPINEEISGLSEHHRTIMERLAKSAIELVTTNDELLGTIDSLFCILREAFYHMDGGNMRRAWITIRRATMAAQLMGLHRERNLPIKCIDPGINYDPQFLWFRIVSIERVHSLLLGLPSSDYDVVTNLNLQPESEISPDLLETFQYDIMGKILERNRQGVSQSALDMTRDIDRKLLDIAERLPARFWRPLNFVGLEIDSPDALWETLRARDQLWHYTLLNQIHLPYLLCPTSDYSRHACVHASRDLLTRFNVFRTFNPITACCRMADFIALIGGMTLMLAHIVSHCYTLADNVLVHQRLEDRAKVEQALECMERSSKLNEDMLTDKCAKLLRHLLRVEKDAAQGQTYRAHKVQLTDIEREDERNVLLITVPYFGTIRIAGEGIQSMGLPEARQYLEQNLEEDITIGGLGLMHATGSRGSTRATPDPLPGLGNCVGANTPESSTDPQPMGLHFKPLPALSSNTQLPQDVTGEDLTGQPDLFPDLAAGVDDWAFQGIDTAFFDSVMRGPSRLASDGANAGDLNFYCSHNLN